MKTTELNALSLKEEKTVILKRNDLIIDGKECQVVNFIDISSFIRLK